MNNPNELDQTDGAESGIRRGRQLLEQRLFEESEKAFREASTYDSALKVEALYGIGVAQLNQKKTTSAIKWLEQALEVDPRYVNALFLLGYIYDGMGEGPRAAEYYRAVLVINQNHAGARDGLNKLGNSTDHSTGHTDVSTSRSEPASSGSEFTYSAGASNDKLVSEADKPLTFGAYDNLRQDKSPTAHELLKIMTEVRFSGVRPRHSAYLGTYLTLILAGSIGIYAYQLFGYHRIGRQYVTGTHSMLALSVGILCVLCIISKVIHVSITRYTLESGRLWIGTGLFSAELGSKPIELFRIQSVSLHRTISNMLTGDCTMVFQPLPNHGKVIEVRGVFSGNNLHEKCDRLNDYVRLCRLYNAGVIS